MFYLYIVHTKCPDHSFQIPLCLGVRHVTSGFCWEERTGRHGRWAQGLLILTGVGAQGSSLGHPQAFSAAGSPVREAEPKEPRDSSWFSG